MRLYRGLTRVFRRSFSAKLMAVVFVGVHVPLLVLLLWMAVSGHDAHATLWPVVGVVLGATVVGTAMAMLALYRLMAPLRQAADALEAYYDEQRLPHLPDLGHDEIGRLLRSINRNLHGVDAGLRDLRRNVLLDPLTLAFNRRGCEQALADAARLAQSRRQPLTLFVVDLDNLKPINDAHGHLAGDQVLVRLVDSARAWLQPGEWIGRWGGDECWRCRASTRRHADGCGSGWPGWRPRARRCRCGPARAERPTGRARICASCTGAPMRQCTGPSTQAEHGCSARATE